MCDMVSTPIESLGVRSVVLHSETWKPGFVKTYFLVAGIWPSPKPDWTQSLEQPLVTTWVKEISGKKRVFLLGKLGKMIP